MECSKWAVFSDPVTNTSFKFMRKSGFSVLIANKYVRIIFNAYLKF